MMWLLVATSITTLLSCTNGAALPEAASPNSDATTLVHAGHHADIVLTDQGLQLTRVKKQINGNRTPVIFRYNANTPSSQGLRERRQLQQQSNAIGQPTVQFFTDAGNFNREIQRLFGNINGQTTTTTGQIGGAIVPTSGQGAELSSVGGDIALGGESLRQAIANSANANVAGLDAAEGASTSSLGNLNTALFTNSLVGVTIGQANELVALERGITNENTGNSQVSLGAQENNDIGVPILLPVFSNANGVSNSESTSNNVNLELEGNFGGEQVEPSNSVDATANTQNDASNSKSLTGNIGIPITATRPQSSSPGPLNFITNFPSQSLDTSNLFTNFGNAGTSQGTTGSQGNGEPVVVVVPNGIRSIFGLNNQLSQSQNNQFSGAELNSGVNNEQNIGVANDGVAAAGIRRLKDLIQNPSGQSPRDIFLNELAISGISNPLQTTITNSNPNSVLAQNFGNFGGVNAANIDQIQGSVNNQGQTSVVDQAPIQVLESPQPSTTSVKNQLGLTSVQLQQQPQNIGQVNGNSPNQGAQFIPNQNFVVIPLQFHNAAPGQNVATAGNNSPVLIADPSDPKGFRAQGFATIGGGNIFGQTQQSLAGTNNNRPTSQFSGTPINTIQSNFQQQNIAGANNNRPTSQFSGTPINTIQSNFQQQNQFGSQLSQFPRVITQGSNQLVRLPFAPRGPAQVGFFSDKLCTPIHRCKIISNFGTFTPVRK